MLIFALDLLLFFSGQTWHSNVKLIDKHFLSMYFCKEAILSLTTDCQKSQEDLVITICSFDSGATDFIDTSLTLALKSPTAEAFIFSMCSAPCELTEKLFQPM